MVRSFSLALAACLALSGCASSVMRGYIGQPIEAIMARYGPPTNAWDMSEGGRAFQWVMSSGTVMPSTTTFNVTQFGPITSGSAQTYGGGVVNRNCFYTAYASRTGNSWVVRDFAQPSLACQ